MFKTLLIANRGEIARRVTRTARRMGINTVALVTAADRSWPHWREADEAIEVANYSSIDEVVAAARKSGAEAVHPGYGFLSENADFAEACTAAGLVFVGPPAAAIRSMGSKADAKALMALAGVPVVPGYGGERQEAEFLRQKAYELGYPVLIKAVSGGGGRGMRRVDLAIDFPAALAAAKREAHAAFGDDRVLLERYVKSPRHIEVQVFADTHGNAVHVFERDCSVQRRHQKVIEEAPATGLTRELRRALGEISVLAARAIGYRGAGTVEFMADASAGLKPDSLFFIEMNTRLQVEHTVTEAVTGLDLVEWQLRIAAGEALPLRQEAIALEGHAVEARLYAEDPADGFRPSTGRLWAASFPSGPGIRVDSGVAPGAVVSPHYDGMLAKVIASGADRAEALTRLTRALGEVRLAGPATNLAFLSAVMSHPDFLAGGVSTDFVDEKLEQLTGAPLDPALAGDAVAGWVARTTERLGAASSGPWARADAFQLGGLRRGGRLTAEIDGKPVSVEIDWTGKGPKVASIGGHAPARSPGAEIVWGEREVFILSGGRQLRVAFPDPLSLSVDDAGSSSGEVLTPIHGRIVAMAVKIGQRVRSGDPLFTMEAMKLEHAIVAPLAGIVRAVRFAAGQQVQRGVAAVQIEPVEEAAS